MPSFLAQLLERAAKSYAQAFAVAFLGSVTASITPGVQWSVPWWQSVGLAAVAAGGVAGASALTSVLSKNIGTKGSASLLKSNAIDVPSTVTSTTVLSEPIQGTLGQLAPTIPDGYTLIPNTLMAAPATTPASSAALTVPAGESMEHVDPTSIPGYGTAVPAPPPVTADYQTAPVTSAGAAAGGGAAPPAA